MTLKDVQEPVQLEDSLNMIVQECVRLRKQSNESIVELSKWLDIDRRKIMNFEKGKFDIYLAKKILNWYGKELTISFIS